ncbi:MAG: TrbC/VirB2 family protein [Patescibacteria group bacterium]
MTNCEAKTIVLKSVVFMFVFFVLAIPLFFAYAATGVLENPLRGTNDLTTLIIKILGAVVKIGGYVAVLAIIWSGFLFVKAQGNKTELETAKSTFMYTIIGVAVLLAAQGLALALGETIKSVVR